MKNVLIFLFGATVGAVGTLLWLRKDIRHELEEISKNTASRASDDVPFTVGENKNSEKENKEMKVAPITESDTSETFEPRVSKEERIAYSKIVSQNYTNESTEKETKNDLEPEFEDGTDIIEIDIDEYMNNKKYEKDHLVYFRGDSVMSGDNGVIIADPASLVGSKWTDSLGKYSDRTAFIRNQRLLTDFEIYVEEGLYVDEFGDMEYHRED